MPKVSIIVPIYNVEQYLTQCLDSILNQTLRDIEIVCVDDGSTDGSGAILDYYAQNDGRIIVLHRSNAGYGAAMNAGIKASSGDYIGIVESDDKIAPDMFGKLYQAAETNHLDMVKSDCYYWFENIDYLKRIHVNYLETDYDKVLTSNDRNIFFDFFMNIWTGIYSRDFLDKYDIRFHESPGASYQDNGFWMQTCLYADRVMWLNEAFYYYRQDNPTASVKSPGKMLAMTYEYEYLETELRRKGNVELLPYCWSARLFRLRGTYFRIADELKLEFVNQVRTDYEKYKPHIRYQKYMDKWIREILADPEGYTQRLAERKRDFINSIGNTKQIIIYGAGVRGDMVFRTLYNEGHNDRICCFAMSSYEGDEILAARPVLQIDEAIRRFPEASVLIAVIKDSGAYKAMEDRLKELGIESHLDASVIEECFYIL